MNKKRTSIYAVTIAIKNLVIWLFISRVTQMWPAIGEKIGEKFAAKAMAFLK